MLLPLKIHGLGKENCWSSLVAALVMDTQVLKLTVELTTQSDSPLSGLMQTQYYSTYELNLNPDKTIRGNNSLLFHMPFHEHLPKKMRSRRRNTSHSADPHVQRPPFQRVDCCNFFHRNFACYHQEINRPPLKCTPTQNTSGNR